VWKVQISRDTRFCPEQNFSSPVNFKKSILKPLIVLGHANNHQKVDNAFYNSCIGLTVRFPTEQSEIYNFGLLLTVKSELTSAPRFSFWNILGEIKDGHPLGVLVAWYDIYYTYIRITHYQSFNAILLTCKLSTSSAATSSTNLYLPHATWSTSSCIVKKL
jgi:hypothetical protein